jgi:putative sigma-54 modulation protein
MRTIIKGKNVHVNDQLKKHVEQKLVKITRHTNYVNIKEMKVEFSVEKNPSIANDKTVEITVFTKGPVIRAKEASTDLMASVDLVVDKLDKQMEKYKGKFYHSQNHKARHEAIDLKHPPSP